jgi:putative ABC transport system permease protein
MSRIVRPYSMGVFANDVRHALRMFTRSRGLAAFTVLILVVGVLLNTAAFGIINAVWFRPLPLRDADEIVVLTQRNTRTGAIELSSSSDILDLQGQANLFTGVAAFAERQMNVSRSGSEPRRVTGGAISSNAASLLGVPLTAGRWFTAAEEASGSPVAIAAPGLAELGAVIAVDGVARTVVGVIPHSFRFVYAGYQVLTPLARGDGDLQALARLAPGIGVGQIRAAQTVVENRVVHVEDYREAFRARHAQYGLLLGAAALILLIVCANLSGLFVARNAARQKEFAIRMALGAPRFAVLRIRLAEALTLAAAAGVLSVILALWLRRVLVAAVPELEAFVIDYRVLAYTLLSCLVAALACGLAPVGGGRRLRGALVVAQLAMGIMLLAGAAMLATSVRGLRALPTGLRTDNLRMFDVSLSGPRYADAAARERFWSGLVERLDGAALASVRPLSGGPREERILVQGGPPAADPALVAVTAADSRWFDVLGIPLVAGRRFARDSNPVAVVNRAFVRRYWGMDASPDAVIGRRVRVGDGEWLEVIGVMADARQRLDLRPFPEIVRPYNQARLSAMSLILRSSIPADAVRGVVRAADPDVPVAGPADIDGIVENYYPSVLVTGLRIFAVMAMALSTLGLYGVVSFLTARRSREIGIRVALGATRVDVVRTVLAFAVRLIVIGAAVGLAGSMAVGRVLQGSMAGVSAAGPSTLATIAVAMSMVASAAAALPAWQAARLDPSAALRQD